MADRFSNQRFPSEARSNIDPHRTPLFFKLWFGFIATMILAGFAFFIYLGVQVVQAGPEGVGQTIGAIVRGFNEAADRR